MQSTPKEIYELIQLSTAGKDAEIAALRKELDCLKEETSETEIVEQLLSIYDAPKEVIEQDVRRILDSLRSIGAIDE